MRKGLSPLLSGVLYLLIVLVGITIVVISLYPKILQMKHEQEISDGLRCVDALSNAIEDAVYGGVGTAQEVRCDIPQDSAVKIEGNYVLFIFKHIPYLSSYVFKHYDYTYEEGVYVYDNGSYILMGNNLLEINLTKRVSFNAKPEDAINYIKYKPTGGILKGENISIMINNDPSITYGSISTYVEKYGNYLGYGKALIEVSNLYGSYNLTLILYPHADYVVIGVERQ